MFPWSLLPNTCLHHIPNPGTLGEGWLKFILLCFEKAWYAWGPQRFYDLVPFFLLPSMIKLASSTPPNSVNGTINTDNAKSPGVGMEATKPPLVENHCCRWGSMSLTLACCSVAKSCPTLCDPMDCSMPASLSFTVSQSLLKLMSIESVMPSTISSSVGPFSSCPQSFPASGSSPMSWLFSSCCQSIGASA